MHENESSPGRVFSSNILFPIQYTAPPKKWTCTIFDISKIPWSVTASANFNSILMMGHPIRIVWGPKASPLRMINWSVAAAAKHSYRISWVVGWWEADMSPLQSFLLLWEWGGGWDRASGKELVPTAEALLVMHSSVPPKGLNINFYVVGFKWWIIQTYGEAVHEYISLQGPFQLFPLIQTTSLPKYIFFFLFFGLCDLGKKKKVLVKLPVRASAHICIN